MKKVIVVAGPTGTGKTGKAIELARELSRDSGSGVGMSNSEVELVNADSRQISKYLRIGTNTGKLESYQPDGRHDIDVAPPTYKIDGIPIHLISFLELDEKYNVYEWKKAAEKIIQDIFERGKQPIIVGGTGLYIDALVKNYNLESVNSNSELRGELSELDVAELQDRLKKLDLESYSNLNESDLNNPVRLIRLIEKVSIKPNSPSPLFNSRGEDSDWEFEIYYPNYDWYELKEKIGMRVEQMFKEGILQEAESIITNLTEKAYSIEEILELNVANIMGYKQIFEKLLDRDSGRIKEPSEKELAGLIEQVTISHRQYARRQRTWFERGNRYDVNKFVRF